MVGIHMVMHGLDGSNGKDALGVKDEVVDDRWFGVRGWDGVGELGGCLAGSDGRVHSLNPI